MAEEEQVSRKFRVLIRGTNSFPKKLTNQRPAPDSGVAIFDLSLFTESLKKGVLKTSVEERV